MSKLKNVLKPIAIITGGVGGILGLIPAAIPYAIAAISVSTTSTIILYLSNTTSSAMSEDNTVLEHTVAVGGNDFDREVARLDLAYEENNSNISTRTGSLDDASSTTGSVADDFVILSPLVPKCDEEIIITKEDIEDHLTKVIGSSFIPEAVE